MIRNVVFDMGQVLIRWQPEQIMAHFALSADQRALLSRELFASVEWVQLDRGILTGEQLVKNVCARVPESLHPVVQELAGWFRYYLEPMPGMEALIRELKENGYGIFLLSNASVALRQYFPRIPGSDCFDGLMVSGEEKLLKPQHEIYERLYDKFQLDPAECWFIDDAPANIEGAILTGMGGTIFRGDAADLRHQLRQAGIRCKEEGEA